MRYYSRHFVGFVVGEETTVVTGKQIEIITNSISPHYRLDQYKSTSIPSQ